MHGCGAALGLAGRVDDERVEHEAHDEGDDECDGRREDRRDVPGLDHEREHRDADERLGVVEREGLREPEPDTGSGIAHVLEDETLLQQEVADDRHLRGDHGRHDVVHAGVDEPPHDRQVHHGAEGADHREQRHLPEPEARQLDGEVKPLTQGRLGFPGMPVGEVERHLAHAEIAPRQDLEQDLEAARFERRGIDGAPVDEEEPGHGSLTSLRRMGNIARVSAVESWTPAPS